MARISRILCGCSSRKRRARQMRLACSPEPRASKTRATVIERSRAHTRHPKHGRVWTRVRSITVAAFGRGSGEHQSA
jgi:hypothetical protein